MVGALQIMEILLRSELMLIPHVAFATIQLQRKTLDDVMAILGSLAQIRTPDGKPAVDRGPWTWELSGSDRKVDHWTSRNLTRTPITQKQ
jgi:hypothetical protein